jgi:hypothetical protein
LAFPSERQTAVIHPPQDQRARYAEKPPDSLGIEFGLGSRISLMP